MTPEEQRITIAEACGWDAQRTKPPVDVPWGCQATKPVWYFLHQLPDYPNDLNAMHEAEKLMFPYEQLEKDNWNTYLNALGKVITRTTPKGCWPSAVHATAAQRAEAFLRTIGKWTP